MWAPEYVYVLLLLSTVAVLISRHAGRNPADSPAAVTVPPLADVSALRALADVAAPFEDDLRMISTFVGACKEKLLARGIAPARIENERRYQYCISNRGGDKVGHKGTYNAFYAMHLEHIRSKAVTVMEIGVWKGLSLAVWSLYFPNYERIVGVDVYDAPWRANLPKLLRQGAFPLGHTVVLEADTTNASSVAALGFPDAYFDVIIDDGCHRK